MTAEAGPSTAIACTLSSGDFRQRLAWIAALNRDALHTRHRDGRRLELTYAPDAVDRVSEMVHREQQCCAFLSFTLHREAGAIRLVIEAPEAAAGSLDAVFEPFEAPVAAAGGCGSAARHDAAH
ncbi:MAG: hypothetical protein RIM96_13430 [Thalassobaculum sp.]|uniref:hypothetical protein n=1 Tax=Thalassobaculum sp. TaxID=2022740 RepID=UPI0032EAB22E